MGFLGTALNSVGLVFLTHAIYSTHEHTTLHPLSPTPLDITIELLLSIVLLSAGIVLSSPALKPIQWARWAGKLSREGRQSEGQWTAEGVEILGEGDPFEGLLGMSGGEGRRGFWDGRGKRKEYVGWVKGQGK